MNTVLFTLFIHFCTPDGGCTRMPLSEWETIEQCQAQVPVYYALVEGDYTMECE